MIFYLNRFVYSLVLLGFISCDSEHASPCFQSAGTTIIEEFDLDAFNAIRVAGDMQLIIKQGETQQVEVKSGEHIIDEVKLTVEDSLLVARYDDGCNLARDYGVTQLIVTLPELKMLRNASSYDVIGEGTLRFAQLQLESNTLDADDDILYNTSGFDLSVHNQRLTLSANGKALFRLKGKTEILSVNFADKTARLEGRELIAQQVEVFHRSANAIIVNPQRSLSGIITGPGDLISVNRPASVEVNERFTGKLIFENQ
uniref:Putative auto-transporter adhesin head GIN domain-containing protein n=1 Tax=uncultured Flavobacteriia bacterium TaxID=212695 RepID=H6RDU1_9BACT|nr:conserved hypothetical protein [uncultured bacterium]CCF99202.1 conserved hypothetical protein [uncultured Flavobacteriia bacterium]